MTYKEQDHPDSGTSIGNYLSISSFIRHKAFGSINSASMVLYLIDKGGTESESNDRELLLEMLGESLDSVTEQLKRSHDLDRIIYPEKTKNLGEAAEIHDLLEFAIRSYGGQAEIIVDHSVKQKTSAIGGDFDSVFTCIFRNAIIARRANRIVVTLESGEAHTQIKFLDDGDCFSHEHLRMLEGGLFKETLEQNGGGESTGINYDEIIIDLLIAKEILRPRVAEVKVGNMSPKGCQISLSIGELNFIHKK